VAGLFLEANLFGPQPTLISPKNIFYEINRFLSGVVILDEKL